MSSQQFDPNSFDSVLSKILTNQEAMCAKMEENHTSIISRFDASDKRFKEHEASDTAVFAKQDKRIEKLNRFKWMAIGIISFIAFIAEHGFGWIFGGGPSKP